MPTYDRTFSDILTLTESQAYEHSVFVSNSDTLVLSESYTNILSKAYIDLVTLVEAYCISGNYGRPILDQINLLEMYTYSLNMNGDSLLLAVLSDVAYFQVPVFDTLNLSELYRHDSGGIIVKDNCYV